LENPVGDEEVLIAMRRALRSKLQRPRQALGLTQDLRDQLIRACPDTLTGQRDRALIALGYDTLCRRAELVGLRVEDLSIAQPGPGGTILIRRAKNDRYGHGRQGYVSKNTCKLLRSWLRAAKIDEGYIPTHSRRSRRRDALHPYSVNRILRKRT
jgi:integrase